MVLVAKNDEEYNGRPPLDLALSDSAQHCATFGFKFGKSSFGKHIRDALSLVVGFKIAPHIYQFFPENPNESIIVNSYTFVLSRLRYNFAFGSSSHLYKCSIKQIASLDNATATNYLKCISGDGVDDVLQNMLIPTWSDNNSFGFALDLIEYLVIPAGLSGYARSIRTYSIDATQNILSNAHKNLLLDYFGLWKTFKAASENAYNAYTAQQEAAAFYQQNPTQANSLAVSYANTDMIGALVILPAALYVAHKIQSTSSKLIGTNHHIIGKALLLYGVSHIAMFAAQIGSEFLVELPINIIKDLHRKWLYKNTPDEAQENSLSVCSAENESTIQNAKICLPQDRLYYNDTENESTISDQVSREFSYTLGAVAISSMISYSSKTDNQLQHEAYTQAVLAGALFFKFIASQQAGHFVIEITALNIPENVVMIGDNNNHNTQQDLVC